MRTFKDGVQYAADQLQNGQASVEMTEPPDGSGDVCSLVVCCSSVVSLKPGYLMALSLSREQLMWLRDRLQGILDHG